MRYFVEFPGGREIPGDVSLLPTGGVEVLVDGVRVEADAVDLGGDVTVARIDGHVHDLWIEGKPPEIGVVAGPRRFFARVESERMRAAAVRTDRESGDSVVKSPMPGRVLKLLVAVDDEVHVGQPLVVVEAMKMENELMAERAGSVKALFVSAGQTVDSGQKLLEIG